jgi:hypothetical protein
MERFWQIELRIMQLETNIKPYDFILVHLTSNMEK